MFTQNEDEETCTVTIKNVPKNIKWLFESLSSSITNEFNMIYGEKSQVRKTNLFIHMTLAKYIQECGTENLSKYGIKLDKEVVDKNPKFEDLTPKM